jgi:large-conductance mechanosensitive channel
VATKIMPKAEAAPEAPAEEVVLLREIRDALRERS